MPPNRRRPLDNLFFLYFMLQIPSTLFFDTQGVYSPAFYPDWLRAVRELYLEVYRDPFMADAWDYPWFLVTCLVEHFIGISFFFWASYAYYYGATKKPHIIIPIIIYSTHTLTAVIAIWAMALGADFSDSESPAPRTFEERLTLCSAYSPFFFIPFIMLLDAVNLARRHQFDHVYR